MEPHHNREIKIYSTKIKADAYFRSATSNYPVMEFTIPWVDSGFSSSFAERRTFFALVDFDHYLWLSEVQIWEKSAFQDILRALYWTLWDAVWKDLWIFYRYYLRKAKILGKVLCHLSFLCDFVCKFDRCAVWLSRDHVPLTRKLYYGSNLRYWLVWLVLYLQVQKLWFWHFLYEYFPVLGKGLIKIERWEMSARAYYPLRAVMKLFDIVVGIFTGLLDIIWYLAKVVSLSFRLTGNITSGTILLGMLIAGLKALSIWLSGRELPLVLPLIVIAQGLLSAVIQAFVFALLTAIFIKVATEEW